MKEFMTETETLNAFASCDIDMETKARILQFVSGYIQGIYNFLDTGFLKMNVVQDPDFWAVGYNKLVELLKSNLPEGTE
jgi:hypothetical protein